VQREYLTIDRRERTAFDSVAELYNEVRPGYPEDLVDDILSLSDIPDGGRILEIGCGPGNATLPFGKRGYKMLCLELGERLAAFAVKNCCEFPGIDVRNTSFEEWELEKKAFDLAISGDAFHWIPPEIGYPKAAHALKDSGSIALFWVLYLDPDTEIFRCIDDLHHKVVPRFDNPNKMLTSEWLVERIEKNFKTSGCFKEVSVRRYSQSETYTGEQYIKLLETFSSHQRIDKGTRNKLFAGILKLIDQFGGNVERPYLINLFHSRVKR
jgi:SAM-dependent methyltransferase